MFKKCVLFDIDAIKSKLVWFISLGISDHDSLLTII